MRMLVVAVALIQLVACRPDPREVVTTQGVVRGYRAADPPHYGFYGIPYGAATTPATRYKAPKKPPKWDGIFEATHRVMCPQPTGVGEENCLVVNIFVPVQDGPMPVLVMLHDGYFYKGWGSFTPPRRLLQEGFIVVTFNYRVGFLGFLSLGHLEAPGNAGLKDQVAALYWINRNIRNFGGNFLDVTLYGVGAGAASIQFLLSTDASKDLFHKAIIESGSNLSPIYMSYNPIDVAFDTAKESNFKGGSNMLKLTNFYKNVAWKRLRNNTNSFLPCIENSPSSIIETDPIKALKNGIFHKIPILFVHGNQEGVAVINEITIKKEHLINQSLQHFLPDNVQFDSEEMKQSVSRLVENFYLGSSEQPRSIYQDYVDYFGEVFVVYPMMKSALFYASQSNMPVYFMEFSYSGNFNRFKEEGIEGGGYGDVYKYISSKENLQYKDEIIAKKLVYMWSNFIRTGDPTPITTSLLPEIWQPIRVEKSSGTSVYSSVNCMQFGFYMTMEECPGDDRFMFWDRIYKMFYRPHKSTGFV